MIDKLIKRYNLAQHLTKRNFDYFLLGLFLLEGLMLNWDAKELIVFGFLFWFILNPIKSTILAGLTVLTLISISVLLILGKIPLADTLAAATYLLLCLTLLMVIYENYFIRKKG